MMRCSMTTFSCTVPMMSPALDAVARLRRSATNSQRFVAVEARAR